MLMAYMHIDPFLYIKTLTAPSPINSLPWKRSLLTDLIAKCCTKQIKAVTRNTRLADCISIAYALLSRNLLENLLTWIALQLPLKDINSSRRKSTRTQ